MVQRQDLFRARETSPRQAGTPPGSREGGNPRERSGGGQGRQWNRGWRGPGLLPLHPLLISAVQEHVLRGHVDHQGHGGFGFSLETGRKEAGGSAGSSGANSGHADPGPGSQGGRRTEPWWPRPRQQQHRSVPGRPSRAVSALTSPPGDPSLPPEGGILTEGLNESFVWTFYHNESDPGVWGGADLFRQNL